MNMCTLTLKPFLGSLKTPEDKNSSYFFNRLDIFAVNFCNVCNMGCQINYVFMVLKLVRSLGSLKTPKTVKKRLTSVFLETVLRLNKSKMHFNHYKLLLFAYPFIKHYLCL